MLVSAPPPFFFSLILSRAFDLLLGEDRFADGVDSICEVVIPRDRGELLSGLCLMICVGGIFEI